jgi:hypothetical protein
MEFADSFTDPELDPRTYLVAVDQGRGEYIGLVRVWMNRPRPRIGMFGVLRTHRRRNHRCAPRSMSPRRPQGRPPHGDLRFDETNEASRGVFERLGARETGTTTEFAIEPPRQGDVSRDSR